MGHDDEARDKLITVWIRGADGFGGDQAGCVAVRLLERLAPSTDDPEGWARLPSKITVYRVGSSDGFAWTIDRETAMQLARQIREPTGARP